MTRALDRLDRYRAVLFDLDGTLHRSGQPLPGAAAFVARCRAAGLQVGFVTNASLPTRAHLRAELARAGVDVPDGELLTGVDGLVAALAADGVEVVAYVGGDGLREGVTRAGLAAVALDDVGPGWHPAGRTALAFGVDPEVRLRTLGAAAALIEAGLPLYTTTLEPRYPTADGLAPGTGAMVAAVTRMAPCEPVVCGKPSPTFAGLVRARLDGRAPVLVVGDTPEADVALARALAADALLVLTGTTTADAVADCNPAPTYVAPDLATALAALAPTLLLLEFRQDDGGTPEAIVGPPFPTEHPLADPLAA